MFYNHCLLRALCRKPEIKFNFKQLEWKVITIKLIERRRKRNYGGCGAASEGVEEPDANHFGRSINQSNQQRFEYFV